MSVPAEQAALMRLRRAKTTEYSVRHRCAGKEEYGQSDNRRPCDRSGHRPRLLRQGTHRDRQTHAGRIDATQGHTDWPGLEVGAISYASVQRSTFWDLIWGRSVRG